jgi:uncharacterized protein
MKPLLLALAASLALLSAGPARASETPIPPAPAQWVTDNAGFLSSDEQSQLNTRLSNYQDQTGHQVIVWIGQTTGDTPLEEWTISAFTKWKVGQKGLDDGAALFIFAKDHAVRIEVGYGLEGVLTDAQSSEIIRNEIIPKIKAGNNDGAVDTGVSAILAAIGGESQGAAASEPEPTISLWQVLVVLFLIIVFVTFAARNPGLALALMYTLGSGGGGFGGGGFGGGGFSGGGGMGGGGGASGRW